MNPTTYKRPPITEAVIEIRIERKTERSVIEKVAKRLRSHYVHSDTEETLQFAFDARSKENKTTTEWSGLKMSSEDRTDTAILRLQSISSARLAPYNGWDELRGRAFKNWEAWRRAVGKANVSRVGVRYINRIDIPKISFRLEDYVNTTPSFPSLDLPPISNYTMQVIRPLGVDACNVIINSGIVSSPLIEHTSIVLDIDVYASDVAQGDQQVWDLIDRIRDHKNRLFEACVTNQSRELFNQ